LHIGNMIPASVWERARALGAGELAVELRGWRGELVGPRRRFTPTVSEVCSPCPTKRDVYLSRVVGVRPEGDALRVGAHLHSVFLEPVRMALSGRLTLELLAARKAALQRGLSGWLRRRVGEVFEVAAALALAWLHDGRRLPVAVEPELPGSPIGFSGLVRPDLLVASVPVEFVLGNSVGRKELAVAAYGMALEAAAHVPVNFGVVAQVPASGGVSWRLVLLDDELRRRLLDARDEVARIVEEGEDPGPASSCSESCPWGWACRENPVRV